MTELDRTLYISNIADLTTEEILYELFLQAGPLEDVKIVIDKDGSRKGYAFVTFVHDISVPYSIDIMNGIKVHGSPLSLKCRKGSSHEKNDITGVDKLNHSYARKFKSLKYLNFIEAIIIKEEDNNFKNAYQPPQIVNIPNPSYNSNHNSYEPQQYPTATSYYNIYQPYGNQHYSYYPQPSYNYPANSYNTSYNSNYPNNVNYFTPPDYQSYVPHNLEQDLINKNLGNYPLINKSTSKSYKSSRKSPYTVSSKGSSDDKSSDHHYKKSSHSSKEPKTSNSYRKHLDYDKVVGYDDDVFNPSNFTNKNHKR